MQAKDGDVRKFGRLFFLTKQNKKRFRQVVRSFQIFYFSFFFLSYLSLVSSIHPSHGWKASQAYLTITRFHLHKKKNLSIC